MRKIQTLITFFERIFAWGHQNHPDPHCRCYSHPQTPICLWIFPTVLVPRARKVACETADKQSTCSRPRGAACVRKKAFFLLERWIEQRPSLSKAKSLSAQSFSAAKAMSRLPALDMGGVTTDRQVESLLFDWDWELRDRESFVVSHFRSIRGTSLVACTQTISLRIDPLHVGAVRWDGVCNLTLSCRLRSSSERRIETKFSLQLETLDVCITIFLYSTCKRQARRKPSTPAIRCGGQAPVELLLFVANPRGLKLIYTHWHWASKSICGWLHLFSQTARLVSRLPCSPPYKSEKLAKSCTSVATSAEQAELFRVVREGHPIPESTCWTSPIVIQRDWLSTHTTLAKKKNHHRDSRREERCSRCDIMLDQARSAQGKSDPRLSATFAMRWSRLIEHDITRGTAFFSPRISRMVLFFGQGSSCMPLQQLPTVTKDANAHARLGYVRSQSLASTTTFPVETKGRLGKLLPTSALKNVGKTKSTPLSKAADQHIFSPPDDAHRCSSDAESTRKTDRANFRSSSTRPHSYRSPDKCVKKGHLHWGEPCEPLRLAISWSSWWCYCH